MMTRVLPPSSYSTQNIVTVIKAGRAVCCRVCLACVGAELDRSKRKCSWKGTSLSSREKSRGISRLCALANNLRKKSTNRNGITMSQAFLCKRRHTHGIPFLNSRATFSTFLSSPVGHHLGASLSARATSPLYFLCK